MHICIFQGDRGSRLHLAIIFGGLRLKRLKTPVLVHTSVFSSFSTNVIMHVQCTALQGQVGEDSGVWGCDGQTNAAETL